MKLFSRPPAARRKAVWGPKRTAAALLLLVFGAVPAVQAKPKADPGKPKASVKQYKMDDELTKRSNSNNSQTTRVIVEVVPGAKLPPNFAKLSRRKLGIINGEVLDVPNGLLKQLAANPSVFRLHYDRPAALHNYRTGLAIGSTASRAYFGLTGAGVGVAIIDSGIASWHDDLTGAFDATKFPYGNQRVAKFVDFVNGQTLPYDDHGHGTHVAGIIAGNGYDSGGRLAGVAPKASLVSLKVLDANGYGTISNIIAALDWVAANHAQYNIRVINMSVGAAINESYWTDPLTLAAKRVADAGVVVVAAAGNIGKNAAGQIQYGGITAPGNAPWVLTVGASSTNGTAWRGDDTVAAFSSRGPANVDFAAKPDIVAPGMGTVSLAAPGSTLATAEPQYLIAGTISTATRPYLALSGTSMASPVVAGTVALMLQANPSLTPNAVKAILEYTAQTYPGVDALTQGAGFLNALGAIRLAIQFKTGQPIVPQSLWSKHILWGNQMLSGGVITPSANAWASNIVWGAGLTGAGDNIVWGSSLTDNIVWGDSVLGDNIVWGNSTLFADNIVWGEACGGDDCDNIVWGSVSPSGQVWGTAAVGDNIVWGSSVLDNIVWGSSDSDNIVWGSSVGDNIVWGSSDSDNIVWGSSDTDNIVWGSSGSDNIVWGSSVGDNIVWGSSGGDNIVWGTGATDNVVWGAVVNGIVYWGSSSATDQLWGYLASRMPPDAQIFGLVVPATTTTTSSTTTTTSTVSSTTSTTLSVAGGL